jgi:hypothetical protein
MQIESIAAVVSGLTIGGLLFLSFRRRRAHTYTQSTPVPTWPETEGERRGYAEEMRVAQMVSDAKMLLYRQYHAQPASRRHMERLGVSARRWKRAVLLLRHLHIYTRDGYQPAVSEYHAQRKLERFQRTHAARVTRSPAAYVSPN